MTRIPSRLARCTVGIWATALAMRRLDSETVKMICRFNPSSQATFPISTDPIPATEPEWDGWSLRRSLGACQPSLAQAGDTVSAVNSPSHTFDSHLGQV